MQPSLELAVAPKFDEDQLRERELDQVERLVDRARAGRTGVFHHIGHYCGCLTCGIGRGGLAIQVR